MSTNLVLQKWPPVISSAGTRQMARVVWRAVWSSGWTLSNMHPHTAQAMSSPSYEDCRGTGTWETLRKKPEMRLGQIKEIPAFQYET